MSRDWNGYLMHKCIPVVMVTNGYGFKDALETQYVYCNIHASMTTEAKTGWSAHVHESIVGLIT